MKTNAIKIILWFWLAFYGLGQLFRIPIYSMNIEILGLDIFVFLANAGLFLILFSQKNNIKIANIFKPVLWLVFIFIISFLINLPGKNITSIFIASGYLLRLLGYLIFCIFFVSSVKILNFSRSVVNEYILYSLLILAGIGLCQYFFLPDTRFLYYLGWDDHYYRLLGPLLDPNFSGLAFIFGIVILATDFRLRLATAKPNKFHFIALVFILSLLLTFSRGSWLVFGTTATVFLLSRKKYAWLAIGAGLFGLMVWFLPKPFGEGVNLLRTSTIRARVDNFEYAFALIKTKPVTGLGYNFLHLAKNGFSTNINQIPSHSASGLDNSWLFTWATGGLLAISAMVYLVAKSMLLGWRNKKKEKLLYFALAIGIHSLFYNSFYYPFLLLPFWLILAMDC